MQPGPPITDCTTHDPRTACLPVGYFGNDTGAAAALLAASAAATTVQAVVLRGGRVDLARRAADTLDVPTLLIVGQRDFGTNEANEMLFLRLKCQKKLSIIPHAAHSFEELSALDRVAELATQWFTAYLARPPGHLHASAGRRDNQ